ncbi:hypothetical protein PUMCH_003545 [Australozyma saopauloensis]|uniref:Derlin n=1 Tax=Australozyma saopauloensis TaxID=291208 RepID=A0AAX4HD35_9ASCO|nr:hypothetical protein PUMCH_003545 [[Candida] saopauloensis]
MASPIFVSNPRAGYSLKAFLRGIQLAILGTYRLSQSPRWKTAKYLAHFPQTLLYSIVVQLCLCCPIFGLKVLAYAVSYRTESKYLEVFVYGLQYVVFDVLHLPIVIVSAALYFSWFPDESFMATIKHYDELNSSASEMALLLYSTTLALLEQQEPKIGGFPPTFASIQHKYKNSQIFLEFAQRISATLILNLLLFTAHKVPIVGSIAMGLIAFQSFNEIIGTDRAVVLFLCIQAFPHDTTLSIMTYYWGCKDLMHDLLMPFFSRVKLSNRERQQWMKSRGGPLLGFAMFFFLLINRLPWMSFVIYDIASGAMAYFLTKLSDPPPTQTNRLIDWNVSQMLWSKEKEQSFLLGQFALVDEGYASFPGSSLFIVHHH